MKKPILLFIVLLFLGSMCYGQLHSIYDKDIENSHAPFYLIVTTGIGLFLAVFSLAFKKLDLKRRRNLNITALLLMLLSIIYQVFFLKDYNLYNNRFLLLFFRNTAISFWCYDYASSIKFSPKLYRNIGFFLPGLAMFLLAIKKHKTI